MNFSRVIHRVRSHWIWSEICPHWLSDMIISKKSRHVTYFPCSEWLNELLRCDNSKYLDGYVDTCIHFLTRGDALRIVTHKKYIPVFQKYMSIYLILVLHSRYNRIHNLLQYVHIARNYGILVDEMREYYHDQIDVVDNIIVNKCITRINEITDGQFSYIFESLEYGSDVVDEIYWPTKFKRIMTYHLMKKSAYMLSKIDRYFISLIMVYCDGRQPTPVFQSLTDPTLDYSLWLSSGPASIFLDSREMMDEIIYVLAYPKCAIDTIDEVPMTAIGQYRRNKKSSKNMWYRLKHIHGIENIQNLEVLQIINARIGNSDTPLIDAFTRPL